MSLYIYHHLGLGDHIICNAIVRKYANENDIVYLFVKSHNYDSVQFMYRDLSNVELITGDDKEVKKFLNKNNIKNILKIGFENLDIKLIHFEKSFYKQVGIDFEKRWTDFFVQRDNLREDELYNSYNINENYVFLHDDEERGFKINEKHIVNKDLRTIKPIKSLTSNIFDYLKILENATEIHCIDSSFKLISDSINIKSNLIFYHLIRKTHLHSSSSKNWTEIKY